LTEPAIGATGVPINTSVAVTFSEQMNVSTLNTSTITLTQAGSNIAGTVTASGANAIFTPSSRLASNSTFTATVTTGAQNAAGLALAANFVWTFTTGATADTTAPTVTFTNPAAGATGVPLNSTVAATFSEAMNPLTLNTTTFTLATGSTMVAGSVGYAGDIATFTPGAALEAGTTYTATVTTAATDLVGNALASNFVWSFTTGCCPDTTAPTVISEFPVAGATMVPVVKQPTATFSESMDPTTLTTLTFTLSGPGGAVTGTVTYDQPSATATFAPAANLAPNATYTATITTGAKSQTEIPLASNFVWSFKTGQAPVNLGQNLSQFAVLGGSTVTNTVTATVVTGFLGVSPGVAITGFPPGTVDGVSLLTDSPPFYVGASSLAGAAQTDLTNAINDASNPSRTTPIPLTSAQQTDLGGSTLTPGLYIGGSSLGIGVGETLTLDAQGDADAVFVFQAQSTLITGTNSQVVLINNANPANIFWSVGSSATLGVNSIFQGNALAQASNTADTGATITGLLASKSGAVTLDHNTVTKASP